MELLDVATEVVGGTGEVLNGIGELSSTYPIFNYLVVIVVAIIFTNKELKKRHKKADDNRAADLAYRAAHEIADMAFRAKQAEQMTELTSAITNLSDTLNKSMERTDARFAQVDKERLEDNQARLADNQETNKRLVDIGKKLVFLETYLQLKPMKEEENLTADVPELDSKHIEQDAPTKGEDNV